MVMTGEPCSSQSGRVEAPLMLVAHRGVVEDVTQRVVWDHIVKLISFFA